MKISLIIPMYNVEQYIERCLKSVLFQKGTIDISYEIIVINDGSKDSSLEIAKKYEKQYCNFCVLTQSNKGLSEARNAGLSVAKGDYVWFIDSDDWIAENSLNIISKMIDKGEPDLICFRAINSFGDKLVNRNIPFENINKVYSGKEIIHKRIWSTCVPFYIFKRSFLNENNLRFCPGIFHEDNEFTPRMLYYAQKVYLLNDILYFVYQNPNSITRSVNFKKSFDLLKVAKNLYVFKKNITEPHIIICFNQFISLNINNALYGTNNMPMKLKHEFNKQLNSQKEVFECLLNSKILKYMIEGYLFKLFNCYTSIYKCMQSLNHNN